MQWILWFGQIVAFVIAVISLLWMIGGGLVLVLQLLAERQGYDIEGEKLIYRH